MKRFGQGIQNALKQRLKQYSTNKVAKVGIVENQTYEDGTSVAYVGTIHEFGVPEKNIPPRPFMRPTAEEKRKEWVQGATNLLKQGHSADNALAIMGDMAVGDIVETIASIEEPPLKDATIKARERRYKTKGTTGKDPTKPLNDTELLIESIAYVVEDGED